MVTLPVRVRASGVVLRGDQILLVEYDGSDLGHHFNLPGGGVDSGETVRAAARRELWEETQLDVRVGKLLLVWEAPTADDRLPGAPHGLDLVFLCAPVDGAEPRLPDTPDDHQIAVRWFPLAQLESLRLLPPYGQAIHKALAEADNCVAFYGVD